MKFCQVNVFSKKTLGNPVGCFLPQNQLTQDEMQQLANWMNLSETIFIFPSTKAKYKIRIFTPTLELPFAGHPTVGSALAATHFGLLRDEKEFTVECTAGVLNMKEKDGKYFVETPDAKAIQLKSNDNEVQQLMGDYKVFNPLVLNNGPKWLVVRLEGNDIHQIQFDNSELLSFLEKNEALGLCIYQISGKGFKDYDDCKVMTRCLFIDNGIVEDPVCGSANACIGHHLKKFNKLSEVGTEYKSFQGACLKRWGAVEVIVSDTVWIGGDVELVLQGDYCL